MLSCRHLPEPRSGHSYYLRPITNYVYMNFKTLLLSCVGMCSVASLSAQATHDVSSAYLTNNEFDTHFDYAATETGNVAQEIREVEGWTKNITVDYTITGVYQIGTAKTFNGAPVPATAHDGTTNGGVLALSTGWTQEMKFYQEVTLPAGTYTLATAFYNGTDKTLGKSVVGWIPAGGSASVSALSSFANGWTTDNITFTLTKTTKGKIQIGYGAMSGGSGNQAKVCLDYVRLLRTTPIGQADVDLKKEALAADIAHATAYLAGATTAEAAVFEAAIEAAQAVHDKADATIADVYKAQATLAAAYETYSWQAPTGPKPTVTTNKRFARGATMAFGRLTATGTGIVEQGFCWSTSPQPTINDNCTTTFLSHNGNIYWIKDLEPSTCYYMRAYAITKGKQVGYGEVIRFYTIPKGTMRYTMRTGGDEAARTRIDAAMKDAVNWWNNLTSIQGVNFNVGHNPGTPTADCSYGGYIRVGSNTSYQRTGTMLHEMAHGVGIGTHNCYWESDLRANGDRGVWLGDRVTSLIRFWDNSETATVTGDNIHFWPYGINGAHEDNGTDALYIIQSLLVQAFGEDGLPPSGGFASPAHSFDHDGEAKYYLKSESENHGLYTSYMVENDNGTVALKEMTNDEAMANDNAAWTISFEPRSSFYAFKNVGTGHYLAYQSPNAALTTTSGTTPATNSLFHLMRSRVDATKETDLRGYWLVHNNHVASPYTVVAKSGTTVATATYSLANSAKAQRWLILTQAEMGKLEASARTAYTRQLADYLAQVRKLRATPHTEDAPSTDQIFDNTIAALEAQSQTATTAAELGSIVERAKAAGFDFLANATPTSMAQPFDLTFMIKNPGMEATDGWSQSAALNHSTAEYYQATFDFNQTIANLPAGSYQLKAQAFQRPGSAAAVYSDYAAGNDKVNTFLYAGTKAIKVAHAASQAQAAKVGVGSESTLGSTPATYIPNDMQSASAYFARGLYDNEVFTDLTTDGSSLKFGIRSANYADMYWTIFGNFRLYYYGSLKADVVSSISEVAPAQSHTYDVYSLDGRLVRKNTTSLDGLPSGIYIVGGKKVVK